MLVFLNQVQNISWCNRRKFSQFTDDFEEITWTPDIRNADNANGFSTEDGTYTKIGGLLHFVMIMAHWRW